MLFDIKRYSEDLGKKFDELNDFIRVDILAKKGYLKEDGSVSVPNNPETLMELSKLIFQDERVQMPSFTEEELKSYFING